MATVKELMDRYDNDPELQKDVADMIADGKATPKEISAFCKKYQVKVSVTELADYVKQAKEAGFIH